MTMTPLCTAGYEGRTVDDLVRLLTQNEIRLVVDVRERPFSRKRGLSKSALSELLASEGVEYVHARELGNPKHFRDALRQGWAFEDFAAEFMARLDEQSESLGTLRELASAKKTCLLCFEADPRRCHRSLVARALIAAGDNRMEVVHLGYDC